MGEWAINNNNLLFLISIPDTKDKAECYWYNKGARQTSKGSSPHALKINDIYIIYL